MMMMMMPVATHNRRSFGMTYCMCGAVNILWNYGLTADQTFNISRTILRSTWPFQTTHRMHFRSHDWHSDARTLREWPTTEIVSCFRLRPSLVKFEARRHAKRIQYENKISSVTFMSWSIRSTRNVVWTSNLI